MEIICGAPARSARPFLDFLSPADVDLDRFLKGFIADFWRQGFRYGLLLFLLTRSSQTDLLSIRGLGQRDQAVFQTKWCECVWVVLDETLVNGNN